jgi:hypothetical protein
VLNAEKEIEDDEEDAREEPIQVKRKERNS